MQWKPIETAPKDGTIILLCDHLQHTATVEAGFYNTEAEDEFPWVFLDPCNPPEMTNGWQDNQFGPTHWMPLPEPPK